MVVLHAAEKLEMCHLLVCRQQKSAARLADAVEHGNDGLEVALVENRQRQLQVTEVSCHPVVQ